MKPACREAGPNRLEIDLITADGYQPCHEFYLMTQGAFHAVPTVLRLPRSKVEMVKVPQGVRYHVEYPAGGGFLRALVKAIAWPFTARAVARQLMEANEVLEARYQELETAKTVLALQTTKLRTAHEIGELVHGDLDLSRTIATVTRTLIDVAGFTAAELEHSADDREPHREGDAPPDLAPVETNLVGARAHPRCSARLAGAQRRSRRAGRSARVHRAERCDGARQCARLPRAVRTTRRTWSARSRTEHSSCHRRAIRWRRRCAAWERPSRRAIASLPTSTTRFALR